MARRERQRALLSCSKIRSSACEEISFKTVFEARLHRGPQPEEVHMTGVIVPEIETERLLLRGPTSSDVDTWAAFLAEPDVLRYLPKRAITPRERAERSFNSINLGWQQHPVSDIGWVITLKGDGQLIGWCGAGTAEGSNEAELVYSLGKPYWSQGYATEAARALVRFGFERVGWERIVAAIIPGNVASRRVLEHLGFVYEKDVNYYEMTGDSAMELDSPILPLFAVTRERFAHGDAFYRLTDGSE